MTFHTKCATRCEQLKAAHRWSRNMSGKLERINTEKLSENEDAFDSETLSLSEITPGVETVQRRITYSWCVNRTDGRNLQCHCSCLAGCMQQRPSANKFPVSIESDAAAIGLQTTPSHPTFLKTHFNIIISVGVVLRLRSVYQRGLKLKERDHL